MVKQFCSECGKMLAEHEGLRCDSCIAIERESLKTFLSCLPGPIEKQKVIDDFREELVEEVNRMVWHESMSGYYNQVMNIIRTHRKE